jgi:dipeptidyl-peptidase 4
MLALTSLVLMATPTPPAAADDFIREFALTRRYSAGRPVGAKLTPDGKSVLFLRAQPLSPEQTLFELDPATGQTKELLTPEKILKGAAEHLTAAEKAMLERKRESARGFTSYSLSEDGTRILLGLSGKLYVVERATLSVLQLKTGDGACITPRFTPDGQSVAYVRNNDVFVVPLKTNKEQQVTRGGTEQKPHGLAEFVAQEEMSRFEGYWFSPDGKTVAYQETDHTGMERFSIGDPMHPESPPEAFPYPRPGKANAVVKLGLIPVAGGKTTWVEWDQKTFPYLATVEWPKKGPLTLVVQDRAQQLEQVLSVDLKTGKTRKLLEEKDDAWLNLAQEFPLWLDDGSGFLWMTERNGAPELELRGADGALVRSVIPPTAGWAPNGGAGKSVHIVGKAETVFFTGGTNPTESHLYRMKDGKPEQVLTWGKGPMNEGLVSASDDGQLFVVSATDVRHMPRTALFRADGTKVAELPSVAMEPRLEPQLEIRKLGEDGAWAGVIRPRNFKAGKKLPVILQVYGGPGHQEVMASMRENLLLQWLADRGYIIVKFDARGTPRRGRAWERSIRGDFATQIMADQVAALNELAKAIPEMDLKRVGVYGWSFGGYLAALLGMAKPEVVKAAVAGAPVVDWLDYDTHYTERFLGVPQSADSPAYRVSSLLTYVDRAQRPLLLVHGTADDNVYFIHTLKLSDALFRAGKKHEVLPLSNFTHMVPEPLVTQRLWERVAAFFEANL